VYNEEICYKDHPDHIYIYYNIYISSIFFLFLDFAGVLTK